MPATGPLSHLDLSVGDPQRSIPFYATLLENLGFTRYARGPHHLAFHAENREVVERVYEQGTSAGGTPLDPPAEYAGRAYGDGYYAAFFADPDGLKLEGVYHPPDNP